jgi:ABC-type amino acid transport substrate-binding protein
MTLRKFLGMFLITGVVLGLVTVNANAEGILDKIEKTGKITIGYREGAVPFGYINDKSEWVGFDIDLGDELIKALEAKLAKKIEQVKIPLNPQNRIALVANGTIDVGMAATTITLERESAVDFSLPYFLTGTRLLVPKGSPIRSFKDLAGKKVGSATGATHHNLAVQKANESKLINPPCELVLFEDHTKGFLGLQQGKVDAYFTDESMLAGMIAKTKKPGDWEIVGENVTYEPYGFILHQDDSKWRDFINATLIGLIKNGKFNTIYDKWFGPQGAVVYPMSEEYKTLLKILNFPD